MNYKIVIDAGHGGNDKGVVGNGLQEKDLALQASLYMYERFEQLGLPVSLVRDSDETLTDAERIAKIVAPYGDEEDVILISNHMASGGEGFSYHC